MVKGESVPQRTPSEPGGRVTKEETRLLRLAGAMPRNRHVGIWIDELLCVARSAIFLA
jgi:hypothetical protein